MFSIKGLLGMENPLDVIDEINKVKNKLKRNDEYVKDKQAISEELSMELEKLNEKYHKKIAPESYISLSDLIEIYGEETVQKVIKKLQHISKIKDDNKWIQSKIPCWICELNNHNNVCYDNKVCDRGLDKCIGIKILLIQIKEEEGKLF